MVLSAVLCISLSACKVQEAIFDALDNAEANNEDSDNSTGSDFKYCSKITFETSMDQLFYNKSIEFGTHSSSMRGVLIFNYNTENGDITSAQIELKRLNSEEWAQDLVDTINTNSGISVFMSNPQIAKDPEWDAEYGYLVTADIDLDNVKVNSFIDTNYMSGHNVKALEEEMLEGEIFEDDELGENYTYDGGQNLRIEWFY